VARKDSETGQKPETKQGRRESTREECSMPRCYKSPKKEQVSHMFKHLVANIKSYNADKI